MERGEAVFGETGCTGCHVPVLETGSNPVEALSEKAVAFCSDFLLHDLGARYGGQTSLSRGDFVPLAIVAVMALVPGYALEVSSRRSGWEKTSAVAKVVLTVVVPAAVTFADRIFRKLRPASSLDLGDPGSY